LDRCWTLSTTAQPYDVDDGYKAEQGRRMSHDKYHIYPDLVSAQSLKITSVDFTLSVRKKAAQECLWILPMD